jgi:hypothetical protein
VIPIALALSLLVGVSLGLLGGGGSILTVPILVYVAGVPAQAAIPMSLIVVGLVSVLGTILYARLGLVRLRPALVFGGTGMVGALLGARLTRLVPERWLLVLFALLMLVVAVSMARKRLDPIALGEAEPHLAGMLSVGFGVGVLTGFLGVGGGFVILPALLWAGRLPMKNAIGTSLAAIALSSASGLLGHLDQASIDWRLTGEFVACAGAGLLAGQLGVRRARADRLRLGFAALVAAVGLVILLQQADLLSAAGLPR